MTTSSAIFLAAIVAALLYNLYKTMGRKRAAANMGDPMTKVASFEDATLALEGAVRRRRQVTVANEREWLQPKPDVAPTNASTREEPPRTSSEEIDEEVTVVMRKQVPPQGGAPRSWIGGLPMMPADLEWPRIDNPDRPELGPVPAHFVCQVAMADLPANLWGGHGPRTGWMLLFAESNSSEGRYRILYSPELGSERQPPGDIGVIHDGTYCDGTEWKHRESVYPRFAVDLVAMPAQLYERDGWLSASPENLANELYPGERVGENAPHGGPDEPFSWRCIALALDALFASLDDRRGAENAARYHAQMVEKLRALPSLGDLVEPKRERYAKALEVSDNRELADADPVTLDEGQARRFDHLRSLRDEIGSTEQYLVRFADADALLTDLASDTRDKWLAQLRPGLEALLALAEERGLDTALSPRDWQDIKAELATADHSHLALAWSDSRGGVPVTIARRELSAMELLTRTMPQACSDVARLYYGDSERHRLIPDTALPALEMWLRSIHDDRPNRMGGYHNGVQSEDEHKMPGKLLLLQMSCDYTTDMLWGDCGAIYSYITPADLDACDFAKAETHLECG